MADTNEFFNKYLPEKLQNNPGLAQSVNSSFQFDIADAGTWSLDLTSPPGKVSEGPVANPGCVITVGKSDWEKMLDNPSLAMQLFMMGKLKASNVGLAMQLQKILA